MFLYLLSTLAEPDSSVEFTATVVIAGLGIVLATLTFLIIVFSLYSRILAFFQTLSQRRKKKKLSDEIKAVPAGERQFRPLSEMSADELPAVPEDEQISGEVVAAISAAVYMMCGDCAVIKSIKKKCTATSSGSVWAQAAIFENTRPFQE